jgi:GNAT superfamily N-acetyltransferase
MANSALVVQFSEANVHRSFVSPNPWMLAEGKLIPSNEKICRIACGISPLANCVYVDSLWVDPRYRRNGYGTELLLAISSYKGRHLPIVVLHEAASSASFWKALRERTDSRIGPFRSLNATDFEAEQRSWHTGQ